jgi:ArsR family transcriptional regulator
MQHLASALRPGGVLLLTDLCAHDQGWARDACGDLWLGFAPADLARWAAAAGLGEGESIYLALRNGFRVQLRVFHKPD